MSIFFDRPATAPVQPSGAEPGDTFRDNDGDIWLYAGGTGDVWVLICRSGSVFLVSASDGAGPSAPEDTNLYPCDLYVEARAQ